MCGLLNFQRLDLVDTFTVEHTDHRAVAICIHVQTVGCNQIVCLCLLLAQDLAAHILNTASAFHSNFRSLLKNYHDTAISLS